MRAGLVLALAAGGPVWAQTAETVVATVNGREITLGHMIVLRAELPAQYQQLPDEVLFKGILDQLVQQSALEQSVEGAIGLRDRLSLDNDRRGFLTGVALRPVAEGAVTEAALQAAYDARFRDAAPVTEWNAAHILVATREEADALKAQIDGGADFAALARAHSTDPGSGARGGDLGWFGPGQMVKPFEDAVAALTAGAVSAPVQSQFGWHIVRLAETRQAAVPTLEETRAELAAEVERAAVEAHIAAVTGAAQITRPGEALDPALLRDQSLIDR
jgi:peptidyl-prolyl cis-trans isomerase C